MTNTNTYKSSKTEIIFFTMEEWFGNEITTTEIFDRFKQHHICVADLEIARSVGVKIDDRFFRFGWI